MSCQSFLETGHDIGVTRPFLPIVAGNVGPEAIHQRVKQFLLQGQRRLWVR